MDSFETALKDACEAQLISGAVLFCTNRSGSFTYSHAYGNHTLPSTSFPSGVPFEVTTPLHLYSCTKLLTSIAILQLHEQSVLDLDSDVRLLLPALKDIQVLTAFDHKSKTPTFEPVKGPVTIRQLLSHSGGTFGWAETHLLTYREHVGTDKLLWGGETIEERFGGPLAFQPGEKWAYGGGHDWAGRIVEKLSGLSLDEYFKKHIAAPLGAHSLTFKPQDDGAMARCVQRKSESTKLENLAPEYWRPSRQRDQMGGGGCTGTVEDYGKVLASLLRDDGVLLKSDTAQLLFTPQLSDNARKNFQQQMDIGGRMRNWGPGYYPHGVKVDWSLGAMLSDGGKKGEERTVDGGVDKALVNTEWRGNGMLSWGGWPNLFWWVDKQKGIAGIWGTQILPTGDDECRKWTVRWEKAMYERAGLL